MEDTSVIAKIPSVNTYKSEGKLYEVPKENEQEFLDNVKDAQKVFRFESEGKKYDVPEADVSEFMTNVTDAKPLYNYDFSQKPNTSIEQPIGQPPIETPKDVSIGKSVYNTLGELVQPIIDFGKSAWHGLENTGAEIAKVTARDAQNFGAPAVPGGLGFYGTPTGDVFKPPTQQEKEQAYKEITKSITDWQATIPKDPNNVAAKAGDIVPMLGLGVLSIAVPELAPAVHLSFIQMGRGEGLAHAEEVERENKTEMPTWKKDAYEAGYGLAFGIPWGWMIGKLIPKPVKEFAVNQFMKASPELIEGLEPSMKAYMEAKPKGASVAGTYLWDNLLGAGTSSLGMEIMEGGKLGTNAALGENVTGKQIWDGIKSSVANGTIFESLLLPFSKFKNNAAYLNRIRQQGTVNIGVVDGKPSEIYQSGNDYIGVRPDNSTFKATQKDFESGVIIPTDVFENTIKTGKISPTFQRDVFSGSIANMLKKVSNNGVVTVAMDTDGNTQFSLGTDSNNRSWMVNKDGEKVPADRTLPWKQMNIADVHQTIMRKYDEHFPEQAPDPQLASLNSYLGAKRTEHIDEVDNHIATFQHESGNLIQAKDKDGKIWYVTKGDLSEHGVMIFAKDPDISPERYEDPDYPAYPEIFNNMQLELIDQVPSDQYRQSQIADFDAQSAAVVDKVNQNKADKKAAEDHAASLLPGDAVTTPDGRTGKITRIEGKDQFFVLPDENEGQEVNPMPFKPSELKKVVSPAEQPTIEPVTDQTNKPVQPNTNPVETSQPKEQLVNIGTVSKPQQARIVTDQDGIKRVDVQFDTEAEANKVAEIIRTKGKVSTNYDVTVDKVEINPDDEFTDVIYTVTLRPKMVVSELDKDIIEAQKRLGIEQVPPVNISNNTELTLDKIDRGEPVTNEFLKSASDELYSNYKMLDAMKKSTTRTHTLEQIESMQQYLGEEITNLENYANKQTEEGKFITKNEISDAAQARTAEDNGQTQNQNNPTEQQPVVIEGSGSVQTQVSETAVPPTTKAKQEQVPKTSTPVEPVSGNIQKNVNIPKLETEKVPEIKVENTFNETVDKQEVTNSSQKNETVKKKKEKSVPKTELENLIESAKKKEESNIVDVQLQGQDINLNPTEGQKEAGNYSKGHVIVQGLNITIENPIGSVRRGTDEDGKAWEHTMKSHYGYFKQTEGKDGDHIDTFIGSNPESEKVFVIDQINPSTGKFDESKVMIGYNTIEEAHQAYSENYDKDWKGLQSITEVGIEPFKKWLNDGKKQHKPFAEYKETPDPTIIVPFNTQSNVKEPWQITKDEYLSNKSKEAEESIPSDFKQKIKEFLDKKEMIRFKIGDVEVFIYNDSLNKFPTSSVQYPKNVYINLDHLSDVPSVVMGKAGENLNINAYYALLHELNHIETKLPVEAMPDNWDKYIKSKAEISAMETADKWLRIYSDLSVHKKAIQKALSEGKQIPSEVLAEYSDLQTLKSQSNEQVQAEGETAEKVGLPTGKKSVVVTSPKGESVSPPEDLISKAKPKEKDKKTGVQKMQDAKLAKSLENWKDNIDSRLSKGYVPTEKQVIDNAATNKRQSDYEYLNKTAPWGNEKHPQTIELNRLKQEIASGPIKKTSYRLSKDGSFIEIPKIIYDYLKSNETNSPLESLIEQAKPKTLNALVFEPGTKVNTLVLGNPVRATVVESIRKLEPGKLKVKSSDGVVYTVKVSDTTVAETRYAMLDELISPFLDLVQGKHSQKAIARALLSITKIKQKVLFLNKEGVVSDMIRNGVNPLDANETKTKNYYAVQQKGRIYINPDIIDPREIGRLIIHELIHGKIESDFTNPYDRKAFFEDVYLTLGKNEIESAILEDYWPDPIRIQGEEYFTHKVEQIIERLIFSPKKSAEQILNEILSTVPNNSIKNSILKTVNETFELNKLRDVINTNITGHSVSSQKQPNIGGKTVSNRLSKPRHSVDSRSEESTGEGLRYGGERKANSVTHAYDIINNLTGNEPIGNKQQSATGGEGLHSESPQGESGMGRENDQILRKSNPGSIGEVGKGKQKSSITHALDYLTNSANNTSNQAKQSDGKSKGRTGFFDKGKETVVGRAEQTLPASGEGLEQVTPEKGKTTPRHALDYLNQPFPSTIKVDGVDRPTTNSNDKPIHPTKEGIVNFWRWFGESRVTDEQGRPLVVYHGTNADFNEFYSSKRGIWLTPDEFRADSYSKLKKEGESGIIMPLYVKIENPSNGEYDENYIPYYDLGYDGWISKKDNGNIFTIVAKSPSQIKSATGNSGSFSGQTADIRYSKPIHALDYLQSAADIYEQKKKERIGWDETLEGIRKSIQNKELPVRRMEEQIVKLGGRVPQDAMPSRKIQLSYGRAGELFEKFNEKMMKPALKAVVDIQKAGVSSKATLPYMIAKRAIELNPKERQKRVDADYKKVEDSVGTTEQVINLMDDFKDRGWFKEQTANMSAEQFKAWFLEKERTRLEKHYADRDYSGISPLDPVRQEIEKELQDFIKFTPHPSIEEIKKKAKQLEKLHHPISPDELAKNIVNDYEKKVDPKLVENLWNRVRIPTAFTVDTWYKGKQISEETKNEYLEDKYFIPLRGWRESDIEQLPYTNGGERGGSLQHRKGRTSLAGNPLAYIQEVAFQAIGEQVDSEVKQQLLNLVKYNQEDQFQHLFRLKKAYYTKQILSDGSEEWSLYVDGNGDIATPPKEMFESGDVKSTVYSLHEKLRPPSKAREHEVTVKGINGDVVIVFPDKMIEVAHVFNKTNNMARYLFSQKLFDTNDWNKSLARTIGGFTQWMKSAMTQWNVVFPFTNIFRDAPEAVLTQVIKNENGLGALTGYSRSFPALIRRITGLSTKGNKYDDYANEFYEIGGATGWTHMKDVDQIERELEKQLDKYLRDGTISGKMRNLPHKTLQSIVMWNMVFEDATRLSVYISQRESGKNPEQSGFAAKESSVNFNFTGKLTKAFDSWSAFFGAGVQGTTKNLSLFKHFPKAASAVALSFVVLGLLEAIMNDMIHGEEDDKNPDTNYWNNSQYMRMNYLIIPNLYSYFSSGNKGDMYLSIPLSQFWRGFKALGELSYEAYKGRITPGEATATFAANFLTTLLPVDLPSMYQNGKFNVWRPFVPTVIRPFMESYVWNEDYMGIKVAKEPFTKQQEEELADSGLGKDNVNPAVKFFTDALFRAGGGDNKTKRYIRRRQLSASGSFLDGSKPIEI